MTAQPLQSQSQSGSFVPQFSAAETSAIHSLLAKIEALLRLIAGLVRLAIRLKSSQLIDIACLYVCRAEFRLKTR